MTEDRIHVVGTPQFEPYTDSRFLWSREEYCRRVGADPQRPIICYSGCDADTCPDDPIYVEHWIGHRPVTVTIREEQIVLRRAGDDEDVGD